MEFPLQAPADKDAIRWSLYIRDRRCWENDGAERERIEGAIPEFLEGLGLSAADQMAMREAEHLEISIPSNAKFDQPDASRLMPWEFLLTRVTADYRHGRPMVVTRHLSGLHPVGSPGRQPNGQNLSFVASAPLELGAQILSFEREQRLIEVSMRGSVYYHRGSIQGGVPGSPSIVHISGCDAHDARKRLPDYELKEWGYPEQDSISDGFVMEENGKLLSLPATELARRICRPSPPALVSFAIYDSAACLAAAALSAGAQAAVGLQDFFLDELLEDFWARFYEPLGRQTTIDSQVIVEAYRAAVAGQSLDHSVYGSRLVLWTRDPVTPKWDYTRRMRFAQKLQQDRLERLKRGAASLRAAIEAGEADAVTVTVTPLTRVNYSLLHNQQPVFNEFRLQCGPEHSLTGIEVQVNLHAGQEGCEFRFLVDTDQIWVDLAQRIQIPLTASLLRSLQEGLRSTLTARVAHGEKVLYQQSFPITLLAIDEWQDDKLCDRFLPSFILPRDPAIRQIITEALPFLRALQDDPFAAFCGYSRVDANPDSAVQQAQAIWSALAYARKLNYINPPPSYEQKTQRIRFPHEVIADGRGTCLDLALLLAACLEYADLCPVVFLIKNHAFTGFWRDPVRRQELLYPMEKNRKAAGDMITQDTRPLRVARRDHLWVFQEPDYDLLFELAASGSLVALEATYLTASRSFAEAVEAGFGNLRSPSQFDSALDVMAARMNDVTPIPVGTKEAR